MIDQFEIAQILREIALFLELTDEQPKKAISFKRAARSLETTDKFDLLVKENNLQELSGIGIEISKMILTLLEKGFLPYHEHLKKVVPETVFELCHVPGLTGKKLRALYEKFHVESISHLTTLIEQEKLKGLTGFGPSFVEKLKVRLEHIQKEGLSILYPKAEFIAHAFQGALSSVAEKIEVVGALRRKCELIAEIEFIFLSPDVEACFTRLSAHKFVQKVLERTSDRLQVMLKHGIKASWRISDKSKFAFDLLTYTGNEKHLQNLTEEFLKSSSLVLKKSEEEIYQSLGLHFIPPEVREGKGEIAYAKQNAFDLIEEKDLRGAFHCHTFESDGVNSIPEMVEAAKVKGWEYLGISDHSKSSAQANGLNEERLEKQISLIAELNRDLMPHFKIFSGIECDVLVDGQLDLPDTLLKKLDFVIISMHSHFKLDEESMTQRLLRAIENPYTTIVGHLTGRLLRTRNPYRLNIPKILDACMANDKVVELNSTPDRLDMDWRYWIQARGRGLKCSINPDAHSSRELRNCAYGVNIARKGWLTKEDVINTLSLKEMSLFLQNRKSHSATD